MSSVQNDTPLWGVAFVEGGQRAVVDSKKDGAAARAPVAPVRWAVQWRSNNRLDGEQRFFMWNSTFPYLFETRKEAREFIAEQFGGIATRPDLRKEPHGWGAPTAVRVSVVLVPVTGERQ